MIIQDHNQESALHRKLV